MIPLILLISLTLLNLLSPLTVLAQARSGAPFQTPPVPASCRKIGVNFAIPYAVDDAYYEMADSVFSMGWTLAIANKSDPGSTIAGLNSAISRGLTPIVRIGVGSDSGGFFNPADYVAFLNQVASQVSGPFYAVAGPNEPDSERWLDNRSVQYNPGNELPVSQRRIDDINYAGQLLANYMNAVINSNLDQNKVQLLSPTINLSSWTADYFIQAMIAAGGRFDLLAGFSGTSYNDLASQTAKVKKYSETSGLPLILTEIGDTRGATFLIPQVAQIKSGLNGTSGALLFNAFNTNSGWSQFALTDAELAQVLGPECVNLAVVNKVIRPAPRPTMRPCTTEDNPEFHPLRPYPGEPCDPLIPRSIPSADKVVPKSSQDFATQLGQDYQMRNSVAFSCGNSLDPNTPEQFDIGLGRPFNPGGRGTCTENNNRVTCYLRENFGLTLDLTNANIPILGNTQTSGLTDAQKMTEYLSWFLNGTVQQSEQNPNPSISRLVNFSGPLQKLLAFDLKNAVRSWLVEGPAGEKFVPPAGGGQYHNYIVGCQKDRDWPQIKEQIGAAVNAIWNSAIASVINVAAPGYAAGNLIVDLYDIAKGDSDVAAQVSSLITSLSQIKDPLDLLNITDQIQTTLDAADKTNLGRALVAIAKTNLAALISIGKYFDAANLDMAEICSTSVQAKRLLDFTQKRYPEGNLPPDPASYDNFSQYWRIYNNWRGLTNVPIVGPTDLAKFGLENPFVNESVWAQLFQNIPFSSLEDTTGEVVISVSPNIEANQQDKDVVKDATLKLIIKAKP